MTNIKNIKYWEMREARNMYKDMQLAEDCAKELSVIYSKAAPKKERYYQNWKPQHTRTV